MTSTTETELRPLYEATRILVVGCPGSGKTTLARCISAALDLPLYELDTLYFGGGWTTPAPSAWRNSVQELCNGERWIIDGNHASTFRERLSRAHAVVVLDRHPVRCVTGYVQRALRYRRTPLDELPHYIRRPDGRRQIWDRPISFTRFILGFRRNVLPDMIIAIRTAPEVFVVRLGSRAAVEWMVQGVARYAAQCTGETDISRRVGGNNPSNSRIFVATQIFGQERSDRSDEN